MTFTSIPARWLGSLAFCFLSCAGAQTLSPDLIAQASGEASGQLQSVQRFEQAWDVVELMGQPMLTDAQRPARVLLRPQGGIWVDGGCNYFSGRSERDAQGSFRVSKYGGTHTGCEKPPRSEALLNSALMLVDGYRWDRGLVLLSGGKELVRLQPSANQDSQDVERGLAQRTSTPTSTLAPVGNAAKPACRQVKVASHKKGGAKRAKAGQPRMVCKPVAQADQPGVKATAKHGVSKSAGKARSSGRHKTVAKTKTSGKAKSAARSKSATKAKPLASHGKHKRQS